MKGHAIKYSEAEISWLRVRASLPRRDLYEAFCKRFKRTEISYEAFRGMCKRKRILTGRDGRFGQGQTPHNKGKKMPFNENSARTQFKRGNVPHTTKAVGHEMVCSIDGYVYMIVAETNPHTGAATRRVLKHKWLWEQENGPVPNGHCLKCLDGDRTNTDPTNWLLIPRALLPRLNGRWGRLSFDDAEPELKPFILTAAKLQQAAREKRTAAKEKQG